jgi:hypothetical protein
MILESNGMRSVNDKDAGIRRRSDNENGWHRLTLLTLAREVLTTGKHANAFMNVFNAIGQQNQT